MTAVFSEGAGMTREQLRLEIDRRRRADLTRRRTAGEQDLVRLGREFQRLGHRVFTHESKGGTTA